MYKIIKDYKDNKVLRDSFNLLAEKTFGLNFEGWYQTGYWREKYIPYSVVIDDEVVANVSVNITDILWDGSVKHLIQLGTVMTDERYRNKGLIRKIISEIEKDYNDKTDGMYLFANNEVLNLYPKFGFHKEVEYGYSVLKNAQINNSSESEMLQILMNDKDKWSELETAIKNNRYKGQFGMVNNEGLIMFYVTQFMQENVYYCKKLKTYVIAEIEEEEMFIHNIFSEISVALEDVINSFGNEIKKVKLGFVPSDKEKYISDMVNEEDTTLFVKGKIFDGFEDRKIMFPTLAHA